MFQFFNFSNGQYHNKNYERVYFFGDFGILICIIGQYTS